MSGSQGTTSGAQVRSSSWTEPTNVSESVSRSANPAVLVDGARRVHVLWEEGRRVFHRVQVDGQWLAPQSVATGREPAAAVTGDGTVHLLFSNEFGGQPNVFYSAWEEGDWSLPRIVSRKLMM